MARLDLKSGSEYWKERERETPAVSNTWGTSNSERVGLGQAGEKVERRLFCQPSIDVKSDPTGNFYESCARRHGKTEENHWTGKGRAEGESIPPKSQLISHLQA